MTHYGTGDSMAHWLSLAAEKRRIENIAPHCRRWNERSDSIGTQKTMRKIIEENKKKCIECCTLSRECNVHANATLYVYVWWFINGEREFSASFLKTRIPLYKKETIKSVLLWLVCAMPRIVCFVSVLALPCDYLLHPNERSSDIFGFIRRDCFIFYIALVLVSCHRIYLCVSRTSIKFWWRFAVNAVAN